MARGPTFCPPPRFFRPNWSRPAAITYGGFGTSFIIDPREDMIAILMIQRVMTAPDDDLIKRDFLTFAYSAIDD